MPARVCSFNMEWMNDWFTPDAEPPDWVLSFSADGQPSDTSTVARRAANVIASIDPDVLAIQEAPSRQDELELFVQDYLDGGYETFLGDTGGAQKLGLLVKKGGSVDSAQLAPREQIAGLIEPWMSDVDGDAVLDEYAFTRTPLVVNVSIAGNTLQIIVVHTKSNFINRGESLWRDPATRQTYIIAALQNRRRISAEGMRIRTFLNGQLATDRHADVIVLGDLNDGPGLDYFESNYLTHNVTDIIVGSAFEPEAAFEHAQHDVSRTDRYTAVFDDFVAEEHDKHLLLDHILLSPGLRRRKGLRKARGSGRVCHHEYDQEVSGDGSRREDRPSDHRPVSVDLEF